MAERRGLGTYMPNPSHIWQGFCSQLARWKTYTRAYTNNPDWPIILWLRESLFKTTAAVACKYLASGTVLDIGTGPGRLPVLLAETAPNVRCVGVDLELILLHDAVKRASNRRCNDRVSFLMAAVQALPFVDQSFDMVLSTMSLHQWRQRAEGVSELHRVLKNGGVALILVGRREIYPGKVWIFDFLTRKSAKYVAKLFQDAAFKNVEVTYPETTIIQIASRR